MAEEQQEQQDAALVDAIGRGDARAFDELYARYLPLVVRWSMHATGNREVAADLTAEVFAASLTAARRFRPGRGSVAGWLLGIARNKLRESQRRGRVEDSSRRRIGVEPLALTDADLERVEELASLDASILPLLEGLAAPLREALTERVLHERSYEEIAQELRCSESVVRQRVSRALKALRSQLEET
jgi:RNA polymerase sigma-70 factor (ECF subfamily)